MQPRLKSSIIKTKNFLDLSSLTSHALHAVLISTTPPRGFKSSMKHLHWLTVMHDEIEALHQNHTWKLVPKPHDSNVVGSKWVYHNKFKSDGSIERHKACLVAYSFTKILSLDYSYKFISVVKSSIVRIFLSLPVLHQ